MELKGKHVGLAVAGSFYIFAKVEQEIRHLKEIGAVLHPIFSGSIQSTDSRLGDTGELMDRITAITEMKSILKTEKAEPAGPKGYPDVLLIAPCIGDTPAKLASGIMDAPVLMAVKARLRNGRPLVISVFTNNALDINLENIGLPFNMKNIYFIPFGQDDPVKKPIPMIARIGLIENTLKEALEGRQIQPVIQGVQDPFMVIKIKVVSGYRKMHRDIGPWGRGHMKCADVPRAACGLIPLLFSPGSESPSVQAYHLCNIPENAVVFPVSAYAIIIGRKHWIIHVLLYAPDHPLTAPFIIPAFWNSFKVRCRMMVDMTTRVVPASITGHGVDNPSLIGSSEVVIISVYFVYFLKYSRSQEKSLHLATRVMDPHEATAGLITGRMILVKMPKSEHPSILVASTSSSGTPVMYWFM